jgi:tripartite-type tricarboxylate transporter receptor subunit TctC
LTGLIFLHSLRSFAMFSLVFTSRRLLLSALAAFSLACPNAHAQNTVRLMVGFPPGGGTDAIARLLAEKLKDQLGVNVLVDNKAGAGGQLAAQALKAAPADGSVLFLSHDHSISILPQVVKNPGFNPAQDFTPVAGFATFVNVMAVSGGTPAKSLNEYIAWVKTKGKDTVGVPAPADGRHAGQPNCRRRGLGARLHRKPQSGQAAHSGRAGC